MGNRHSYENYVPKHNHKHVWYKKYGEKEYLICPMCKMSQMSSRTPKMSWNLAYIRSVQNGGDDDLQNVLPICSICYKIYTKNYKKNLIDIIKSRNKSGISYDKIIIY